MGGKMRKRNARGGDDEEREKRAEKVKRESFELALIKTIKAGRET